MQLRVATWILYFLLTTTFPPILSFSNSSLSRSEYSLSIAFPIKSGDRCGTPWTCHQSFTTQTTIHWDSDAATLYHSYYWYSEVSWVLIVRQSFPLLTRIRDQLTVKRYHFFDVTDIVDLMLLFSFFMLSVNKQDLLMSETILQRVCLFESQG